MMLSLRTYTDAVISTKRPSHRATWALTTVTTARSNGASNTKDLSCQSVLANIDNVPEKTGVDLNILKGETYFLLGIYTPELLVVSVGTIVDKVYSIEEASALNLPRANVADVMDFILKDIEQSYQPIT